MTRPDILERNLVKEVPANATPSKTEDGFVAHTPGPWTLCYDGQIDGPKGYCVCRFEWSSFKEFNDSPMDKANARLITAAPDLLEALHEVEEFLDNQSDVEDGDYGIPRPNRAMRLLIEVRDAITKARGITP